MTNEQWRDTGERVFWTFTEAAIAAVPTGLVITDWSAVKVAGGAAVVAGGAAVIALFKGMVKARRS